MSPRFATRCARAGGLPRPPGANNVPVQVPIAQTAIFDLGGTDDAEAIFSGTRQGYAYSRFGNPTVEALARALAGLEGGADALVTSSGNASVLCAITAALDGRTGPVVTHHDVYGGTFELLRILQSVYRLPVEMIDSTDETRWLDAVGCAGAVLVETPSNPLSTLWSSEQSSRLPAETGAD